MKGIRKAAKRLKSKERMTELKRDKDITELEAKTINKLLFIIAY